MESSTKIGSFAVRLREIREKRELSQSALARLSGMQPSAIAHFEAGRRKPSFDNIRELAKALHITTDHLMGEKVSATAFRNESELTTRDRDYVQGIIDMMLAKRDNR